MLPPVDDHAYRGLTWPHPAYDSIDEIEDEYTTMKSILKKEFSAPIYPCAYVGANKLFMAPSAMTKKRR